MLIKATRYHYTASRRATIWNIDNLKCQWGRGETQTLIHCWGECTMVQPLWNTAWQFLTKWNILSPYNPAIMLLGIGVENLCSHKTCTRMFVAALFIIAKTWKQLSSPSVDKWVNKLWYLQIMEYHLALKSNEPSSYENNLKYISLNARSQSEKAMYYLIPTIWHSEKVWR